jgi:hypothetical protein
MLPDYSVVPQRDAVPLYRQSHYAEDPVLSVSMCDEKEDDYRVNK